MAVIQKQNFVGFDKDTDLRLMEPGSYRYALNVHVGGSEESNVGSVENIKGNTLVSFSLPAGTNKVLGSYEDIASNCIYYFLYNSSGTHGIYKYDGNTNAISKIFEWSGLNFQADKIITGVGKIGNIIGWTDNYNPPRALDLENVSSYQTPYVEEYISLIKRPPNYPVSATRQKDSSFSSNYIQKKFFQFATQFVYEDDSVSVLSPFSKISADALIYTEDAFDLYTRTIVDTNYISLDLNIDDLIASNLRFMVKKIHVLVREGNTGNFGIFKTLSRSEYTASQTVSFYNDRAIVDVGADLTTTLFDSVPLKCGALVSAKNRFFLGDNTEGFDKVTGFTCSLAPQYTNVASSVPTGQRIFKDRGVYQTAIVFYDEYMRAAGVCTDPTFVARIAAGGNPEAQICTGINLQITGTPPEWAHYYSIVRTKNLNQGFFFQTKVLNINYLRNYDDNGAVLYSTSPFNGWIETHLSLKWLSQSGIGYDYSEGDRITVFYTNQAGNPFSVDLPIKGVYYGKSTKTFGKKILSTRFGKHLDLVDAEELGETEQQQQIDEFSIVVENFDFKKDQVCFVEIYSPVKRSDTEFYYDIGEVYPIDNPGEVSRALSETNITLNSGDSYYIARKRATKEDSRAGVGYYFKLEMKVESYNLFDEDFATNNSDIGKAFVEIPDERQQRVETSIRFGNTLVQDSQVNGLFTFPSANKEILPDELGAIRKLQAAADNQAEGDVVLAIHEFNTSSLYIGISIIKDNSGKELFASTDSVIGTVRTLRGGYGTMNPESIIQKDGKIYGWDVNKGVVWRYGADGMTPISDYFMKNYFYNKSRDLITVENARAHGGYDPFFNQYIITFDNGSTQETIAFSELLNRWTSFYSFTPEGYQRLNTRMLSFKNGALYKHSENSTYNNFYGVQYTSKITPVCNIEPSKEKILQNVSTESKHVWVAIGITNPEGQSSDLIAADYYHLANAYSANVLRDRNTPSAILAPGQTALLHGDVMRSSAFEILMENTQTTLSPLYCANFKVIASERSNK